MKISTAAREYLIEIEVRKFTPKTIRSYRNNLNLFLRYCETEAQITDVDEITLATIRQFTSYLSSRGKKGSYINGLLRVAKVFIQYCYDEGYGGFNTRKNFKWCRQDKAVIMAFKPEDVRRMVKSCKGGDYLNIRDAAIITTLFETGIRCWELCCIQKKDIHDDFNDVVANLSKYTFVSAQIEMVPQNYQKLETEEHIKLIEKLIEIMEDDDDVQNVWHNWEQE